VRSKKVTTYLLTIKMAVTQQMFQQLVDKIGMDGIITGLLNDKEFWEDIGMTHLYKSHDESDAVDFMAELLQEAKDYLEEHDGSFHQSVDVPDDYTSTHYIMLEKEEYDEIMKEIMDLKPRKRKNWKRKITDRYGCDSKCRYRNGKIENYQGNHRSKDYGKWLEVVSGDFLKANIKEETAKSSSMLGHLLQKIYKAEEEGKITKEEAQEYREQVMEMTKETFHTGKHTAHNHNIMCGAGLYGVGK
tara:strand:- start:103 stop:837 length:735 start_codon:yes stop_codon:yes gene_type:complete